jgi:hypothetical protein
MPINNLLELACNLVDGLVPGDALEPVSHALERVLEPVGVMLVVGYIQPFSAGIALTPNI